MSIVLINNSMETFTPTRSGAIATFIWECARAADRGASDAVVISRSSESEPYARSGTEFVDFPATPGLKPAIWALRLQRRLNGWREIGQSAYARRVAKRIDQLQLGDATLMLNNDPEMAVHLARRFPEAHVIHHFHNHHTCKSRYRKLYAAAGIRSTGVSNFTARWVESHYGLPDGSVRSIYNGVDSERFRPEAVNDCEPVIGFVGRTGIEKAPDLLLKASLRLAEQGLRFGVQIVGANHWGYWKLDPYQAELKSLSERLAALGVNVEWTGFVDRDTLPAVIRRAHIHVVPSRWDEPFGLTTLEGMASGLAVVASRTGGTPEVVGDSGLLFDRDHVQQLADQLAALLTSPDHRHRYAAAARTRAQTFTWDRTWNAIQEASLN